MTTPYDASPQNPSEPFTPFLPSSYNVPEEDDRLNTFLVDRFTVFSDVINDKKIGVIAQDVENFSGEKFFYLTTQKTRNGYQTMVYIPSWISMTLTLDSLTSPKFPIQDIDEEFVVTQVWGSASLPPTNIGAGDGDYFSFFGEGNTRIQFTMSDIQIIITTDGTTASYSGFIFINYIRQGV